MISKEDWLKELNSEMRFKNMTKKEAEESLYRKYTQQRRHKEIEGYLTEYNPPRNTGIFGRHQMRKAMKNWWSIIKGE